MGIVEGTEKHAFLKAISGNRGAAGITDHLPDLHNHLCLHNNQAADDLPLSFSSTTD